jgi:formylglycine-generating enzyme required for sulfatase activity
VMKYPAKNVSNVATSVPSNPPWVMVTNSSAATQCSNLGSQFRLISNTQWQVVARNAESVGSNWSGGAVGVGSLPQGHIDNAPASLLDNSSMDSDPYYGTNNNAGQGVGAGWEQRRTNRLSNGSVVWDFSGNVWQWVSDSFSPNPAPSGSAWNWVEFSDTTAFPTAAPATNRLLLAPSGSFTSAQRVGRVFWGNAGSLTFVRGCNWNCPDMAGLFSTSTYMSSGNHVGFRCVYMP